MAIILKMRPSSPGSRVRRHRLARADGTTIWVISPPSQLQVQVASLVTPLEYRNIRDDYMSSGSEREKRSGTAQVSSLFLSLLTRLPEKKAPGNFWPLLDVIVSKDELTLPYL